MEKVKAIFISFDMIFAVIITMVIGYILPGVIENDFVKDIYSIGLSILSIVFSVFFAALAVIVSSSDDEFVKFLESEDNLFKKIIDLYKFVLLALLISLLYTFGAFGYTSYLTVIEDVNQPKYAFLLFTFLFSYSLFSVFSVSLNSITYATKRTKYLNSIEKKNEDSK